MQVESIETDEEFLKFSRVDELIELVDKSGCDVPLKVMFMQHMLINLKNLIIIVLYRFPIKHPSLILLSRMMLFISIPYIWMPLERDWMYLE